MLMSTIRIERIDLSTPNCERSHRTILPAGSRTEPRKPGEGVPGDPMMLPEPLVENSWPDGGSGVAPVAPFELTVAEGRALDFSPRRFWFIASRSTVS